MSSGGSVSIGGRSSRRRRRGVCPSARLGLRAQRSEGSCEELGGKPAEYVDRQSVRCPAGAVLSAFRFERCFAERPPLLPVEEVREKACWYQGELNYEAVA